MSGDQLEALAAANARLVRRVAELEQRIAKLEARVGGDPVEGQAAAEEAEPVVPATKGPVAVAVPTRDEERLETRVGLTWLNRVAVVTCVLAAAFFFKYAAENEWIGAGARVALGVLAGMGAVGAAEGLYRRGHKVYAQGIAAMAIGILYLSAYAAFDFYQLVSARVAFGLMALVTAGACGLAVRFASVAVAVLGLLGGYATPLLLSAGEKRYGFLLAYLMVLGFGAMALARRQRWPAVEYVASISGGLIYAGVLDSPEPANVLWLRLYALGYYALFAASERWLVFFAAQAMVALSLPDILRGHDAAFFVALTAATAGAMALAGLREWRWGPLIALLSLTFSFLRGPTYAGTGLKLVFFTVNYALVGGWLPWRAMARRAAISGLDLGVAATAALLYYGGVYSSLEAHSRNWIAVATYVLAAAHAGAAWWIWSRSGEDRRVAELYAGIAAALVTAAIPLQFAGFGTALGWSVEAAALAWIAAQTERAAVRWISVAIFAAALTELFLSEAREYPFFAFAGVAVCLLGAARWFPRPLNAGVYVLGHAVLLSGFILEALEWARRQNAESVRNLETFSVTAVMAVYALVAAGAGVVAREALTRVIGLVIMGGVVLKLYLYDVWQLPSVYRVIAFASLGALLLAMSFLYSKYRRSVEKFIQNDPA